MEIPKSFRPENKDLGEKTEQLLEQPKLAKKEPSTELEEILQEFEFGNNPNPYTDIILHSKIDELVKKEGYAPVTDKRLNYEYWAKQNDSSETCVLIRTFSKTHISKFYSFAIIKTDKLEKFLKIFDKYTLEDMNDSVGGYNITASTAGLITGVSAGLVLQNYLGLQIVPYMIFSIFNGVLSSFTLDWYMHKRKKQRMEKHCEELTTDDKEAVRKAFS